MVAGEEAKRRDGYCTEQLPHLAIGDWFSVRLTTSPRLSLLLVVFSGHGSTLCREAIDLFYLGFSLSMRA
jgi:hypothetical protein